MSFLAWLESTPISVLIRESPSLWGFPFILFLHTLGLGTVAGLGSALNLWAVLLAPKHRSDALEPVFGLVWIGFTIALVSGIALLLAYPTKALTDPVFYAKITLIVVALIELRWLRGRVFASGEDAGPVRVDMRLKIAATGAIAAWAGAVLTGRLLAYTYRYLMASSFFLGI